VLALGTEVAAAAPVVMRLSSDPYSNPMGQHSTGVEPDSFARGSTLVSAFQVGRRFGFGATNLGWASSSDGGRTFETGFLPGISMVGGGPYEAASDPVVAYDAAHRTWLISGLGLAPSPSLLAAAALVSRSSDGVHWSDPVPVFVGGPAGGLDKEWTVCDNTRSSPFFGHCYTHFMDYLAHLRLKMSTSTDGGQSWGAPLDTEDAASGQGGEPVVQRDGTVIVPFIGPGDGDPFIPNNFIAAFRSTDGGKTWSAARNVHQTAWHPTPAMRTPPYPAAETDRAGNVYLAWHDCRFRGCEANDIVLSKSADGLKWTEERRVPIDSVKSGADHFIPGLAVDPRTAGAHARLALTYYSYPDADCSPDSCELTVGFITSMDGGATWGKPRKLAGPMPIGWFPDTYDGRMVGDYIATSFVHGRAFPFFAVANAPKPDGSFDQAIATIAGGLDAMVALSIKGSRLTLGQDRRTRVKLACPAAEESPPCAGTLRLTTANPVRYRGKKRHVTLAAARFRIGDGDAQAVKLRLAERKAALVRTTRTARAVKASARVVDAGGNRTTLTKQMRVKLAH
jgi:hypothetical protein